MTCHIGDASVIIGAKIKSVAHDDGVISIETDRGIASLYAYASCCGNAWFHNVDTESDLVGAEITDIDTGQNEDWDGKGDTSNCLQDVHLRAFGCISTTKGRLTYELRSSSNGYYSGYVEFKFQPSVND